jgi:hypothetical protein
MAEIVLSGIIDRCNLMTKAVHDIPTRHFRSNKIIINAMIMACGAASNSRRTVSTLPLAYAPFEVFELGHWCENILASYREIKGVL